MRIGRMKRSGLWRIPASAISATWRNYGRRANAPKMGALTTKHFEKFVRQPMGEQRIALDRSHSVG